MEFTKDYFMKEIYSLNEEGDPSSLYTFMKNNYVVKPITAFDGTVIDPEYIKKKYTEYLEVWEYDHGNTVAKFISKKDKKKNLRDFLFEKLYNSTFKIPAKKRDIYLFGKLSPSELKLKHQEFIKYIESHGQQQLKPISKPEETVQPKPEKPF